MRNGLPALDGGESSRQIIMSIHLYSKRKVFSLIFLGYKLIIRRENSVEAGIKMNMKIKDNGK